jgi:hypothetical protein
MTTNDRSSGDIRRACNAVLRGNTSIKSAKVLYGFGYVLLVSVSNLESLHMIALLFFAMMVYRNPQA